MLADSIEATVKSLSKPTSKRIEDVVTDTINRKIDDGQFDECALTLREIHEVGPAILAALVGFLGARIEYPSVARGARTRRPNSKRSGRPHTRAKGKCSGKAANRKEAGPDDARRASDGAI